jgi:hypothetical protein
MAIRTTPAVDIQTCPQDVPSIPPWCAEVVVLARHFTQQDTLPPSANVFASPAARQRALALRMELPRPNVGWRQSLRRATRDASAGKSSARALTARCATRGITTCVVASRDWKAMRQRCAN